MRGAFAAVALAACLAAGVPASAGLLSGQGIFVLDSGGGQRTTFSNNERVVLQQRIFNGVASGNRITFRFSITAPNGSVVFQHAGNAVPGTVGNAASQVSGVPVSQFYSGPGYYTVLAEAELDGQTLPQQAQFSVSSPNILLIYPPAGARDLADNPLTFRWSASGASRYRVQVGDNPSLYNSLFSQETAGAESALSYPQNPTDPRQRLTAGQVFYWTVEGLDPAGNVIARSEAPYNFSVRATSLAKDIAVSEMAVEGELGADGRFALRLQVKNQGNTAENSLALRVGVGGLPAEGSPIMLSAFNPGETRDFTVQAVMPSDQRQTLATACLELFDDNVPNNCRTLSLTRPEAPPAAPGPVGAVLLTAEQYWEMLTELLRERGIDISDYRAAGSLDAQELARIIDGLRQGSVQVTLAGPVAPPSAPPPSRAAPPPVRRATLPGLPGPPVATAPEPASEEPAELPEWRGMASAAGKATMTWVIRTSGDWQKRWRVLQDGDAPKVNFKKNIVVGLAAGSQDRADRVEIEGVAVGTEGLIVRYRLVVQDRLLQPLGAARAAARKRVPYIMKQLEVSPGLEVQFERVGGDQ
ncbi:MAG: hypothetical protein HY554_03635 [Elusimicrobia bacterium]|nr:hypothetical protein [Elusimicrobiota bacterium]